MKMLLSLTVSLLVLIAYVEWSHLQYHHQNPTEGAIIDSVVEQVMNSLDEWFDFEEEND